MNAAKASIPIRTIATNTKDKPWFSIELKREIRKRDRLFRIAKRRNTDYDWQRWKRQQNITTDINQQLKRRHIQPRVTELLDKKRDPRAYHNILKSLICRKTNNNIPPLIRHDGTPITDDLDKATILNQHFADQTRLDIQDKHIPTITPPRAPVPSLAEVQVTEPEVLYILNGLDANKSSGPDKIPTNFRMCALLIAGPLTKLFNKSLQSGKFSKSWKKHRLRPFISEKAPV